MQVLACCPPDLTEVHLYVFGSAAKAGGHQPSDVDILLLYREGDLSLAHDICSRIRDLITYPPIDVLALSQKEERETNFINTVNAQLIFPIEASSA
jgi:predicted nucleotidyltransferase